MLSIDFSDSQAKIVSGSFKNGTVSVVNSLTVDFEEGLINGGYVVDIPQVSSIITTAIKSSQMKEKDLQMKEKEQQMEEQKEIDRYREGWKNQGEKRRKNDSYRKERKNHF